MWVIPQRGKTPADVDEALRSALVDGPPGKAGTATYNVATTTYNVAFPPDTAPERLVAFAQQAILALAVAPGQAWQWTSRGRNQLPA